MSLCVNHGVLYFNAGPKHCVHLIVSVASLRRHYSGPVQICCEAEGPGRECAEWIARDDALAPVVVLPDKRLVGGGHGQSYFCKTMLPRLSMFDQTIFLDADTLVVGDIAPLWSDPASGEVVLTQFADWVTTGGKMRQRIIPWREVEPERADRMLAKPWPALNTGVMAWSKNSEPFADDWHHTCKKRVVFMADELAAQIIYPDHPHRVMDDRFNCSVVFPPQGQTVESRQDVRVLHGHGGKFWKRPGGWHFYREPLLAALDQNRGNIQSAPVVRKWLDASYNEHGEGRKVISPEDRLRLEDYWG
jgi:hypothetical protein